MHKDNNERVVLDNLEAFSEKLLGLIADVTPKGRERLIEIIQSAQDKYNKPVESLFTRWVYQFYRLRTDEVKKSLEELKAQQASLGQIREFQKLIANGEWNESSFNHYLFESLILAIPGYAPLKKELTHEVILRLKELVGKNIDAFIQKHLTQQDQKIAPPPPPDILPQTPEKNEYGFKIFINPKELQRTKGFGFGRDLTSSFIIQGQKGQWHVLWINSLGKQMDINLFEYPSLAQWFKGKEQLSGALIGELKPFLAKINTTHSVQIGDFGKELTSCLKGEVLHPKKSVPQPKVSKLDMGLFKKVETCLNQKYGQAQEDVQIIPPKNLPKKLNMDHFKAIADIYRS